MEHLSNKYILVYCIQIHFLRFIMNVVLSLMATLYHLHLDIPMDLAPLRKRGVKGCSASTDDCLCYRSEGKKNVDLWTDGNLYPEDPMMLKHPKQLY